MGNIIGISGKIGSGKDTLTTYLIEAIAKRGHKKWKVLRFAERLKKCVSAVAGVPLDYCYSDEGKNHFVVGLNQTVGELHQTIGNALREADPFFWVKCAFTDYDPNSPIIYIVNDVRQVEEADFIKSKDGILIRLEGDPAGVRANSTRDPNHISEVALDNYTKFDEWHDNGKQSKENLKDLAEVLIDKYYGKKATE